MRYCLAYWFGVRSFDLTKQSFKALVLEIKSKKNMDENKELRVLGAKYVSLIDVFLYKAKKFEVNHLSKDSLTKNKLDIDSVNEITNMEKILRESIVVYANISLYFDTKTEKDQKLTDIAVEIKNLTRRYLEDLMNKEHISAISKLNMIRKEDKKLDEILTIYKYSEGNSCKEAINFLNFLFVNTLKDIIN